MKNFVIIGNGVAAVGCIEGIRSIDKESKITVISEESTLFTADLSFPIFSRTKLTLSA